MAYAIVYEFDGVTRADYDAVNGKLGIDMAAGIGEWPAGILSHAAGPIPGGWVVSEVWESKAAQEDWLGGRLGAALATVEVPPPSRLTEIDLVSYYTP
jgi:hypothetical protein